MAGYVIFLFKISRSLLMRTFLLSLFLHSLFFFYFYYLSSPTDQLTLILQTGLINHDIPEQLGSLSLSERRRLHSDSDLSAVDFSREDFFPFDPNFLSKETSLPSPDSHGLFFQELPNELPLEPFSRSTPKSAEKPFSSLSPSDILPHSEEIPFSSSYLADHRLRGVRKSLELKGGLQVFYPESSRRLGESGRVLVHVVIDPQGFCLRADVLVSSGYSRLDQAAIRSLKSAIFHPALEDGVAVLGEKDFEIIFNLNDF